MASKLTTTVEFLREPMGVVGKELRVGLVLNSSELRLSEPSLRPLLMELLSSQLQETGPLDVSGLAGRKTHRVDMCSSLQFNVSNDNL